jgi:hypothetical protein
MGGVSDSTRRGAPKPFLRDWRDWNVLAALAAFGLGVAALCCWSVLLAVAGLLAALVANALGRKPTGGDAA